MFDTKQEGGWVLYDTNFSEAHEIGAVEVFYDPAERIEQAHEHGLYTITRIVTFEDSIRVKARPEEKLAGAWVDPRNHSAWDYNISLAIEACELGFDEIQFDYVRFPSGRTAQVSGQLDLTQDERVGAIAGFLARAREALRPLGCNVSADVFAIVLSTPDDQGIGQRPEELSKSLDALSPMVYPSHYSPGWLGFPDPNDHPYDVTAAAIEDALPRLEPGTTLRPWLQAFWWTNAQIRAATQAAEDRGVGWILWNARSNFDQAALPTDDEVAVLPSVLSRKSCAESRRPSTPLTASSASTELGLRLRCASLSGTPMPRRGQHELTTQDTGHSEEPVRTSGAPRRAASAVRSSGCSCGSSSASTLAL